jgi:hypothetical protein
MSIHSGLPAYDVDSVRRNPVHAVVRELTQAAVDAGVHTSKDFKSLLGYLLDKADGRDRRETMGQRVGSLRPVPKLRIAVEQVFGDGYAEMPWFRLNKVANGSGKPLLGLYPRMAAAMGRMKPADFGAVCIALLSDNPDAALMRLLQQRSGRIPGVGVSGFAPLAAAFRPDLYFALPDSWDRASGFTQYVKRDLRKYLAVCARLRTVCDKVGIDSAVRSGLIDLILRTPGPAKTTLDAALNEALGNMMAHAAVPAASDAFESNGGAEDLAAMPLEFAARMIRARRGDKVLRDTMLRRTGDKCTITGPCPRDLLEAAHFVPFPKGNVNSPDNAMLLRSDLHTLWDLNLIGIEPDTGKIRLARRLNGSCYAELEGQVVQLQGGGLSVAKDALKQRWDIFIAGNLQSPTKPAAPAREKPLHTTAREEPPRTAALADSNGKSAGDHAVSLPTPRSFASISDPRHDN